MPEAYYDTNTEEIIITADGFASYYDVDIVSQSTLQLVLYTTISGYGDNIDVSSLPMMTTPSSSPHLITMSMRVTLPITNPENADFIDRNRLFLQFHIIL